MKSRLGKFSIIINFRKLFLLWRLATVNFVFLNLKEKSQPFCLLQFFPILKLSAYHIAAKILQYFGLIGWDDSSNKD